MARRAFFSFHYDADNWRAAQIRNMRLIEGNRPATDNDWESIKRGGDRAIEKWINDQMQGKSVVIVLIGSGTAGRKWIDYEIKKAWSDRKGLFGIYIHNLLNRNGFQSRKGKNPFGEFTFNNRPFSDIINSYDFPYSDSKMIYACIRSKMADWIEEAINIRARYS